MKNRSILLICFIFLVLILASCSGENNLKTENSEDIYTSHGDDNYIYGINPDEGIILDAYGDESLWENKNYFVNSHLDSGVSYYVTTHISEKGVYIFAFSSDSNVIYQTRNGYKYNSHFYFIIAASDEITTYNDGKCRVLKLDASDYTQPTNFMHTSKTRVVGEVNSGATEGLYAESFISWEQLNSKPVEEIKLYSAYMTVRSQGQTGTYISNQFASTNPGTYQRYNINGYIETADLNGGLGASAYGTNKSGGIELTDEGMDVISTGENSAFFDGYSSKFIATTKIYANYDFEKPSFAVSQTAKAGIFLALPSNYYKAIQFDLRTNNINEENNYLLSDRLFTTSNYPNVDQIRTNSIYKGLDNEYEYLEIKVIKDESLLYYIVNDRLVYYENLSWLKAQVKVGVYSNNSKCIFKDYEFINCEKNETALQNEINKYAYLVNYDLFSEDYKIEASETAVLKGEDFNFDLFCASGYEIDRIYNNDVDVTNAIIKNDDSATYTIKNITNNINLSVTTRELTNYVTLSGSILDKSEKPQSGATIRISSDKLFTSYIVRTNKNGKYEVNLLPNTKYNVEVVASGFRDTEFNVDVKNENVNKDFVVDDYLVGGSAGDGGLANYISNTAAWDMSKESDGIVALDLQDRKSGGNIYFSNVWATNAVIDVTISNITDPNIGIYEKDPGAGIVISNMKDNKKCTSIYNLYQAGYRVRLKGSYASDSLHYEKNVAATNLANSNGKIKLTLVRIDTYIYMFIDDKLVYSAVNYYISGPAAYGFTFDSSSTLALQYENYSILVEDDALAYAKNILYSKFYYDSNVFDISNLTEDNLGLYNTTPTISVKGLKDNEAAIVDVNGSKYYVTKYNNLIEHPISTYNLEGMPDVNVKLVEKISAYKVIGKAEMKSNVVIVDENGIKAQVATDENGSYELYLPNGKYFAYANLNYYVTNCVYFEIKDNTTNVSNLTLKKDVLVNKVKVNSVDIWSRSGSFLRCFNEKTGRYSVNVGQNGNGGAIYFDEGASSKKILIKYSFEIHYSEEKNPGIGVWVATTSSPDVQNSIRFTFAGNKVLVRDIVTDQNPKWPYMIMENYNISDNKSVYDAAFIRDENTYYIYLKLHEEKDYSLVATYESDTVPTVAAYGFTVATSSKLDAEIFDYSYTVDTNEIKAFKDGANNG